MTADAVEPTISADGDLVAFVVPDAGVSKLHGESSKTTRARSKGVGLSVIVRAISAGLSQRMSIPAMPGGTPQFSASGNAVVYTALNQGGPYGGGGATEVFKVPMIRNGDNVTPGSPQCVSCKYIGTDSDGDSRNPTISEDGRFVAWETTAKNLAPGSSPCAGQSTQIILRDLLTNSSQRLAVPSSAANCGAVGAGARKPHMDWPGRKLVIESDQPLTPDDSNGLPDVYLVDVNQNQVTRISATATGGDGSGASTAPRISGDGEIVAYVSEATNLDDRDTDTNGHADLHVHAPKQRATWRLAKTRFGQEANADSQNPALNYNGTDLGFDSAANNLDEGTAPPDVLDVYQRDNPINSLRLFASGFD